jgi:Flp pilus assembly protein TadG
MNSMINLKSRNSKNQRAGRLTRPTRVREDNGQAIVELALTLPLFLLLLLGTVEFGRLAYASIEVANAAHAGAQYGSENRINAANISGMEQAATNDAHDVTAGLTATATYFCTCSNGTGGTSSDCTATYCTGSGIILDEYVKVNTTATVDPLFHYPGLPTTWTLQGQSIMRVVQ